MTNEEILEGNKLIAEFFGSNPKLDNELNIIYWTWDDLWYEIFQDYDSGSSWISGDFKFHKSWNWIMPIVKKIKEVDPLDKLWEKHNMDKFNLYEYLMDVDIISTFETCVEFIKWYNNEKIINLQEILFTEIPEEIKNEGFDFGDVDEKYILLAMKKACEKTLELASKCAKLESRFDDTGEISEISECIYKPHPCDKHLDENIIVNKQSILNIINQIK